MARINLGTDTSGRPLVVDDRTLAKLRAAETALGFRFTIVQGSYRGSAGAAASAGTHDGGGVIDLRTWDLPPGTTPQDAVLALRRAGLIAWYRTTAQGFDPHIHAIDYGNPWLAPAAVVQVRAWEAGLNGLASGGRDDGPRIPVPTDPPEEDPMAEYADDLKRIETKVDKAIERINTVAKNTAPRDKAAKERDAKRFKRQIELGLQSGRSIEAIAYALASDEE